VRTGEALADGLIEILAGLSPGENVSTEAIRARIVLKQTAAN
jgi:hypothetical protein